MTGSIFAQDTLPLKSIISSLVSSGGSTIIVFLIIAVIMYILAYILSKKTDCIIIWSWWDLIPMAIAGIMFVYYLFDKENKIQNDVFANVLYFVCIITTFALSVISNIKYAGQKWLLFSIISILTKLVIMVIIPLILILLLIIKLYFSGKGDKRFLDGTRDNVKTGNMAIWTSIYMFLIIGLIKTGKEQQDD
jgi:hypothetical protein